MSLGSGGGRFVRLWRCCLLSVPLGEQASGRRWDCSGLGHVVRRCFGTKWYDEVPGARSTRDYNSSTTAQQQQGVQQQGVQQQGVQQQGVQQQGVQQQGVQQQGVQQQGVQQQGVQQQGVQQQGVQQQGIQQQFCSVF